MYIMYNDNADVNENVIVTFAEHDGKPLEESLVLDKRIKTGETETYSYTEYLVKSNVSDKQEWVSGYFIRKNNG
jgi:hypothetical protein